MSTCFYLGSHPQALFCQTNHLFFIYSPELCYVIITRMQFATMLLDLLMIPLAWAGAYWLRFNLHDIPHNFLLQMLHTLGLVLIIQIIAFWAFKLYRGMWRFASLPDSVRIIKAVITGALVLLLLFFILQIRIPRAIMPLYIWLLISLLVGCRGLYRWLKDYRKAFVSGTRVLIAGAGEASELLLRELVKQSSASRYRPIVLVDDDKEKQGREIHRVRVAGRLKDIPKLVKKHNIAMVIIAIPSAKARVIRDIVALCEEAGIVYRTVPRLNDIVSGRTSVKTLQDIALEDLLGRDPVSLDWAQISAGITNKRILVSGGGGSIGAELCRQIAQLRPTTLIIIDNSEFNLYSIEKELSAQFPHLELTVCLADVIDKTAIQAIMHKYQPQILFHAAAYKHVPMLESQLRVAVKNNVLATYSLARLSALHKVETFILISTDKAVNPTNVMGASKRAAEVLCQNFNAKKTNTKFITVRFGNVLGTTGSVVPLFQAQLAKGQDLTVTHPEVSRYFMTNQEATQLILQAAVMGKGGEIFVLDMGEPIKIDFLAQQMIHLSGKKLGEDVNIVYIGLRPGEKLYEELFHKAEELIPTEHKKILQAQYRPWEWAELMEIINELSQVCAEQNNERLLQLLLELVPEYKIAK